MRDVSPFATLLMRQVIKSVEFQFTDSVAAAGEIDVTDRESNVKCLRDWVHTCSAEFGTYPSWTDLVGAPVYMKMPQVK